MTTTKMAESDFASDRREQSVTEALYEYLGRLKSGDLGSLPAMLGLAVLVVLFWSLEPGTFMSTGNFANLLVQALPIVILGMGLVFVLLLGEIDLSAGVAGGMCAAVMAKLMTESGNAWYVSITAGMLTGLAVGLAIGVLVAIIKIPSFVVTLALFLGLQGVTLRLIGEGGTIPIRDDFVVGIANKNMNVTLGWVMAWGCVAAYALLELLRYRRLAARKLTRPPLILVIGRVAAIGGAILIATAVLSQDRAEAVGVFLGGIPWGVPLVAALLIVCTFVLGRTAFGRHIYAVGGNAEAARRAGINVTRIRVACFMICSTIAAVSGIVGASRLNSIDAAAGSRTELLLAVGAAVIGGTSLFGGKGKAVHAVLGGLVIATIDNGLALLEARSYLNYMITGGVLLLAASVDALARRRRSATGR